MLSVVDRNVVMRRIPVCVYVCIYVYIYIYIYAWGKNSRTLARWLLPNFQIVTLNFDGFLYIVYNVTEEGEWGRKSMARFLFSELRQRTVLFYYLANRKTYRKKKIHCTCNACSIVLYSVVPRTGCAALNM